MSYARGLTRMKMVAVAALVLGACRQELPSEPPETVTAPATVPSGFVDAQFVSGLNKPTQMAFTPDGRLFVCELGGKVRVIKNGALLATPFVTVTVNTSSAAGERGLLGIAIDPNFASNQFVYIYYTATSPSVHNRVARYVANGDVASTATPLVLMDLDTLVADRHNGGGLQFGNDGKLYVGVGENTVTANSQSLNTRLGKMLRVNNDGSIPTDNPFFNTASGVNRSIWAWGLRNPYTFAFRRTTGTFYINDVGNNRFEEIDLGTAGANYDWPATEGPTTNPGKVTPLFSYVNDRNPNCAITGGTFYDPVTPQFPSSYVGQYFYSDFCGNFIRKFDPVSKTSTGFATGISGPVDLDVGPDGFLYYLSHGSGVVGRIRFASNLAPTITAQPANTTVGLGQTATFTVAATGSQPLSYQWKRGGANIAGATSSSYTTGPLSFSDNGATFMVVVTNSFGSTNSATATLTVLNNQPPTASIDLPAAGSLYSGGETITYAGSANDPEMGALGGSAFTWSIDFHHATHIHPFLAPVSGSTGGSVVIPRNDETDTNVWYRIHLTVTDPAGLVTHVTRDFNPRIVNFTLVTSPPGLSVTVDGQPMTAPVTLAAVVGTNRSIGAPSPQGASSFVSWSDGGAATHTIIAPATATTYTATFGGVTPFVESGGQVVMEAEHFTGSAVGTGAAASATWSEQTATGASGTVLAALPNAGVNTGTTTIGPRRDYAVKFNSTGTYQLWIRLSGANGNDDSVHAGLNGTAATLGGQGISNGATLGWKNVVGTTRVTVNVASVGVATVNLWMREDGVQVDRILLDRNAAFTPTGVGPAESPKDAPATPPAAPTGLVASDGVGQAVLTWVDASNNETGFKIERKPQGAPDSSYAEVGSLGANVQSFTNTPVAAGDYTYRVKAWNGAGASASDPDNASVTAPQPPSKPINLMADDGVGQVMLRWDDTSNNETGFRIERKPQGAPDGSFAPVNTVAANVETYTDTPVAAGLYTYRVVATSPNGDVASDSDDAMVSAPPGPSAPINLVADDGVGQVTLTWDDTSNDETGFTVERKQAGPGSFAPVALLSANIETYTDTSVTAGVYTYRVKSTNANGEGVSNSDDATVTVPSVGISNLVVNDNLPAGCVSPNCNKNKWSVQSNFQAGLQPFGDRTYTVDSVGNAAVLGGPWLRTAADSKNYTGNPLATFTAGGSFVYLVIDNRWNAANGRPAWLTDAAYVDQGYDIIVRQSATQTFPYSVWRKPITSGAMVSLPALGGTTAPAYFVIVK